jgi:hypothetical protein
MHYLKRAIFFLPIQILGQFLQIFEDLPLCECKVTNNSFIFAKDFNKKIIIAKCLLTKIVFIFPFANCALKISIFTNHFYQLKNRQNYGIY